MYCFGILSTCTCNVLYWNVRLGQVQLGVRKRDLWCRHEALEKVDDRLIWGKVLSLANANCSSDRFNICILTFIGGWLQFFIQNTWNREKHYCTVKKGVVDFFESKTVIKFPVKFLLFLLIFVFWKKADFYCDEFLIW